MGCCPGLPHGLQQLVIVLGRNASVQNNQAELRVDKGLQGIVHRGHADDLRIGGGQIMFDGLRCGHVCVDNQNGLIHIFLPPYGIGLWDK